MPVFGEEALAAQASRLTATEWAQPAIGATSVAMLALLRDLGLEPDCLGGHSFGEITALHAALVGAGHNVTVVAPATQQSGKGGSINTEVLDFTPGVGLMANRTRGARVGDAFHI